MFDGAANTGAPYIYGSVTPSYGQASYTGENASTIWRFRSLAGVLKLYKDNTLISTTNEVINANAKFMVNLTGIDVDQITYIEL